MNNEIYTLSDMPLERINQFELEEILTRFNSNEQTEEDEEKLVKYCIYDITRGRQNIEFSAEDIENRMRELIVGKALRQLAEEDFIDVSIDEEGKDYYSLTNKGREYVGRTI